MKLHAMFTDHMVLPANKPLRIFGERDDIHPRTKEQAGFR